MLPKDVNWGVIPERKKMESDVNKVLGMLGVGLGLSMFYVGNTLGNTYIQTIGLVLAFASVMTYVDFR